MNGDVLFKVSEDGPPKNPKGGAFNFGVNLHYNCKLLRVTLATALWRSPLTSRGLRTSIGAREVARGRQQADGARRHGGEPCVSSLHLCRDVRELTRPSSRHRHPHRDHQLARSVSPDSEAACVSRTLPSSLCSSPSARPPRERRRSTSETAQSIQGGEAGRPFRHTSSRTSRGRPIGACR